MKQFVVSTQGGDRLGLRELCEQHANDLWVPDHLTSERRCHFALDHVRRTLLAELKVLDVAVISRGPKFVEAAQPVAYTQAVAAEEN